VWHCVLGCQADWQICCWQQQQLINLRRNRERHSDSVKEEKSDERVAIGKEDVTRSELATTFVAGNDDQKNRAVVRNAGDHP
jgi:hypothetical protein